jgi:hypothetical protein
MTCSDASTLSVDERWVTFIYSPAVTAVGEFVQEAYVAVVEVEHAGKSPDEREESCFVYTSMNTAALTFLLAWHMRESVG